LFLRFSRLLMLTLGVFLAALPVDATTIIARTGTANGSYVNGTNYVSWTQTGTFSNVTIQANVFSVASPATSPATGNAYLTTGATPSAFQIGAVVPISVSNTDGNNPTTLTLFSGLTLGPGTYYVTISDPTFNLAWEASVTGNTTAPGVTANEDGVAFGPAAAYPPATTFANKGQFIIFSATGNVGGPTSIPVLSGWAMLGTMLLLITSGLFLMRLYRPQE
jgi:hypothetical protein